MPIKRFEVSKTFRLPSRDCLTLVGPHPGLVSNGEVLDSPRGVRVQVVGVERFEPPRPDLLSICVQPKNADIRPGDILMPISQAADQWVEVVPTCPISEVEAKFLEWMERIGLKREDFMAYEVVIETRRLSGGTFTRHSVRRDALKRLAI